MLVFEACFQPTPHLYVVLTEPSDEPPTVAVVNFTSHRDNSDETVVLEGGEHSFIKRKTIVNYSQSTVITVAKLQSIIEADLTVLHRERCSPELLERVRKGVWLSPFVIPKFRDYCKGKI